MSMFFMPLDGYRWMTDEEVANFDISQIMNESETGYILEVTLEYPEELHESHSTFPLAPHHLDISEDMLSPYASGVLYELNKKTKYKARKLTSTFLRREKYFCHGINLKYYLEKGMKLVKIHRGITFRQTSFLKPYIDMCTKKRAEAKTKTVKNMMKLLCNSLYGKFIESGANRFDCKFVNTEEKAMRYHTDPRFRGLKIISETLSLCFQAQSELRLNQSWAIGFSILELSKYIMQSLMYDVIMPTFDNKVSVLLSDTDSWVLAVPSNSPDEALKKIEHVMDFSNYPPSHPLFNKQFENQTGFLKNEFPNDPILEVVGVRSKTYALRTQKGMDARCKGVKKVTKNKITFDTFKKCIFDIHQLEVEQVCIQSKSHNVRLLECKKIAFSSFDDKRHLLCAKHSVPYGSVLIEESKKINKCYFCANPHKCC